MTEVNYFDDTQRRLDVIYPNSDKLIYKYDIRRLLESVTDERGKITAYEFDNAYRLTKITDPLLHTREFGYDLMSNKTSYKDPLGNITNYAPDDFNRLKEIEYPAPSVGAPRLKEKFEYDKLGRIKKVTDSANRETNYVYNDVNRIYTVTNAELEATQIKYDQRFQTIEVKDAINQIYQFNYDPLGRLLSQTRAGSTMSFEYDPVGNNKKRTDYTGRVTHYTHDKLNRLEKIVYGDPVPAGAPPNLQATYGYDDISRLTSAVNEAGTVTFGYDNRGRVTSTTDVFGHTLNYEYEYTPTVNQNRLKLDGAMYAVYNFDDANRLINLVNSADSSTISFGYDNEDKLTSRTYPNGVATTYEYDDMDRLGRLKDVGPTGTLFDRQYSYNNASQISQIVDLTQERFFGYDNVDRLTSVANSGGQNENYSFDDVGNRTSSHRSASYGYQPFNQLVATATENYGFDANGNTVRKSPVGRPWLYSWDHENRLTKASNIRQSVRYRYDALGRRVQRYTVGNKENTKFTYDGHDVLLDDNDGTLTKYQNGLGIDNKVQQTTGSVSSYLLADHLGSTNGIADTTGNLTASTGYDSFGNATNANFPSRYQFTGREYDSLTKLHFYRARFYDANLGRFISEDPIGFGGGDVNLYGYVWNNPQHYSDPSCKVAIPAVAYAVFEFCSTGYDFYDFYSTVSDPGSDWIDVGISGGGIIVGTIAPGGGYGALGKGARKYLGKGGVYRLADEGTTMRTGRSVDLPRRARDHRRDPRFKDFDFEPLYKTDDYDELRGLEQLAHDNNPGAPFNFRNPVSPRNPNREKYKSAAENYLCAPCRKK